MTRTTSKPPAAAPSAFQPDRPASTAGPGVGNLWQMPLLLVSLGLFTLAAYLFIDPQPGPAAGEIIARAERDVRHERYDAAVGRLNDLLATRPEPADEAAARLLVAEALDGDMRRSRRRESPAAHRRILRETADALEAGATPTPATVDRTARSWEALGSPDRALADWREAARMLAESGDAAAAVPMRRSAAEMLVAHDRPEAARQELRAMLDVAGLSDDERAWALGELARIAVDEGKADEAMPLLAEALALSPDDAIRGQVNFRLGYGAWKLGDRTAAEGYLTLARRQLGTGHALDAEACYLLGRIAQAKVADAGDDTDAARDAAREAAALYETVVRDHPQSRMVPRARLGRAVCRLVLGDAAGGADDLLRAADDLARRPGLAVPAGELLEALQRGSRVLASRDLHDRAVELLAAEQRVAGEVGADYFDRLAHVLEAQGNAEHAEAESADPPARDELLAAARQGWTRAGDARLAQSRALAMDDAGHGDALWQGVNLYERAGDRGRTIAALERFAQERPSDPVAPDALLRLGQTYAAAGRRDKAVEWFVRLRDDYPQAPAAAEAAIPLAAAYVAQGRERWPLAENVLRGVVEDNPSLDPSAAVFREATWELGRLYYAGDRYAEALAKLTEFADRYPRDGRRAELLFLRGDCYRRAAQELEEKAEQAELDAQVAATAETAAAPPSALAARRAREQERLARQYRVEARQLFDAAVAAYDADPAATDLGRTYERLAHFYRADCLFDLGRYAEAVDAYEAAAFRYRDDPSALAAHVQIVNAHVAQGDAEAARTANERAKWLLRRLPPESFRDGALTLDRGNWERWLAWSDESGLW